MNLDLKWSLWSRDAETFPAEALAALHWYGGIYVR